MNLYVDVGEDLWQTAIRETEEETGVRTKFVAVLTFRHMHEYRWGTSDIYFSCLLRPLNTDIAINPAEIAAATWMDVSEGTKHDRLINFTISSVLPGC